MRLDRGHHHQHDPGRAPWSLRQPESGLERGSLAAWRHARVNLPLNLLPVDRDFRRCLDGGCPILSGTLRTMRMKHYLDALHVDADRPVAYFGGARLVRTQAGRLEVRDGTEADHADAWDWARRFLTPHAPPDGGRQTPSRTGSRNGS